MGAPSQTIIAAPFRIIRATCAAAASRATIVVAGLLRTAAAATTTAVKARLGVSVAHLPLLVFLSIGKQVCRR